MKNQLQISEKSILWFFGTLLALFLLWYIRDIVFLFFIVLLLFAAFNPIVKWLEKIHIPRILSALSIYIVFLFLLALAIYLFVPPLVHQLQSLADYLPNYFSQAKELMLKTQNTGFLNKGLQDSLNNLAQSLSKIGQSAWTGVVTIFGGLVSFLVILVASFYLLLYKTDFYEKIRALIPRNRRYMIDRIAKRSVDKLGAWTLGEIVLCLVIGILYFIVLSILGIKFALLLAILGGILEIIPTVGPIISVVPAVAIAFLASPWKALTVIIAYVLIQQLEGHILVPLIMKKAVSLNPVFTIFALLIGAKLGGILGAIIAVPMLAVIFVILEELVLAYDNARAQ